MNVIAIGKRVPEDGDVQKLMLYAGADQVLQKVWIFLFINDIIFVFKCRLNTTNVENWNLLHIVVVYKNIFLLGEVIHVLWHWLCAKGTLIDHPMKKKSLSIAWLGLKRLLCSQIFLTYPLSCHRKLCGFFPAISSVLHMNGFNCIND